MIQTIGLIVIFILLLALLEWSARVLDKWDAVRYRRLRERNVLARIRGAQAVSGTYHDIN